jgi:hypothetical protein
MLFDAWRGLRLHVNHRPNVLRSTLTDYRLIFFPFIEIRAYLALHPGADLSLLKVAHRDFCNTRTNGLSSTPKNRS